MKLFSMLCMMVLISACSSQPQVARTPVDGGEQCYSESDKNRGVRLDLIRQLVGEAQYHSALAHLEREKFESEGAQFLRAESLRKTGQLDSALSAYRDLQRGCLSALGYLGSGKILAVQGKLNEALPQLKTARDMLPTDANIRNDYGFALLASGDFKGAQQEFVTAIQLENNHPTAIRNLILALILGGDTQTAWAVAEHHRIPVEEFQGMMNRSSQFQKNLEKQRIAHVLNSPDSGADRPILVRQGAAL